MKLYRYEAWYTDHHTAAALLSYTVVRETPKGYWIDLWASGLHKDTFKETRAAHPERFKFVLKGNDGKRFAYTTTDAAWASFRRRKQRHLLILNVQMVRARRALLLKRPEDEIVHADFDGFLPISLEDKT